MLTLTSDGGTTAVSCDSRRQARDGARRSGRSPARGARWCRASAPCGGALLVHVKIVVRIPTRGLHRTAQRPTDSAQVPHAFTATTTDDARTDDALATGPRPRRRAPPSRPSAGRRDLDVVRDRRRRLAGLG
ncbi:hypothetical protein GCM10010972_22970 [Cellulomonas carbonis]|nr:hypothetical protein GCM10010972_22970 [Cellulomonas carbonis]